MTNQEAINRMRYRIDTATEIAGKGEDGKAFEDMEMAGPEQYDNYLRSLYGDYMTPPKEADRNAHVSELVPVVKKGEN